MGYEGRSTLVVETPLGRLGVEATAGGVRCVRLPGGRAGVAAHGNGAAASIAKNAAEQLEEYVRGDREEFDLPLDWTGVGAIHRQVLEALLEIAPYGRTVTYGELGALVGIEDAREVGVHMNRNPLPILVPCHRVVASDGLGGYGGGVELKRRLLELEGALPPSLDLGDV